MEVSNEVSEVQVTEAPRQKWLYPIQSLFPLARLLQSC
jgi:hypothetical protein